MDKTLYINEKKGMEITRDGPSIWIKEEGKAGRRIPARLVGRVIVIGNVKMDAGSITLFANNNVPVTFLDRKGDGVAVAIPYNQDLPNHHYEQRVLLEREENIEKYMDWITAARKRFQIRIVGKLSKNVASVFKSKGFRERDYQDFILKYLPAGIKRRLAVRNIIHQFYNETVLRHILKADLDPHSGVIHRRHNYSLVSDFCFGMEPDIDFQSILFFRNEKGRGFLKKDGNDWVATDDGIKNIAHRYENRKKIVEEYVEVMLDGIFQLIRELRL